jgi:hypothetical protein
VQSAAFLRLFDADACEPKTEAVLATSHIRSDLGEDFTDQAALRE